MTGAANAELAAAQERVKEFEAALAVWRQQETPGIAACMRLNAKLMAERDASQERERVLREAILWALGEVGEFEPQISQLGAIRGPFWWRKELRERAASVLVATPEGRESDDDLSRPLWAETVQALVARGTPEARRELRLRGFPGGPA